MCLENTKKKPDDDNEWHINPVPDNFYLTKKKGTIYENI